jgi:hypothetical protein
MSHLRLSTCVVAMCPKKALMGPRHVPMIRQESPLQTCKQAKPRSQGRGRVDVQPRRCSPTGFGVVLGAPGRVSRRHAIVSWPVIVLSSGTSPLPSMRPSPHLLGYTYVQRQSGCRWRCMSRQVEMVIFTKLCVQPAEHNVADSGYPAQQRERPLQQSPLHVRTR